MCNLPVLVTCFLDGTTKFGCSFNPRVFTCSVMKYIVFYQVMNNNKLFLNMKIRKNN